MAPPGFGDLGKQASDLFSKAFYPSQYKLDVKSTTESGCKFKATSVTNSEKSATLSTVENEFAWPDYGLKFVEKWNTDNQLTADVSVEDQLVKGSKVTFSSSWNPSSNKKKGIVKTSFKQDYINANMDFDFDYAGPTIKGAAVIGYQGWLAGYQMAFDTPKSKLVANNVHLGYDGGDHVVSAACQDGQDFMGSYYHKVNRSLEVAAGGFWSAGSNATNISIAAKYNLSPDTSMKAMVNKAGHVSLSVQQKLQKGVSMTLSSQVDAMNFHAGGHRVGLALEVEK